MKERLQNIPQQPGVYLFKDHKGNIIYVGKAKILRNRIRSYFQAPKNLDPKVRVMMTKVMDLDFIVTNTEVEALILENNLIKEYQPRYNIALRDDKTYPYLKITLGDRFPRICIVREEKDGISKYFGPYTDVVSLRETVKTLTSIFPLRTCRLLKQQNRPCLNRDMGKCLAPCSGQVSAEEYRRVVEDLVAVMEGNAGDIILKLDQEMREAAKHQEFEKAARLRDQIAGIKRIGERQEVVLSSPLNLDIIGLVADPAESLALVFKIRAGKILAKDTFWLHAAINEEPAEIAGFFIKHYYSENADIPPEILINQLPQEPGLIQAWLAKSRGAHVKLKSPRQGEKKRMLNMALYNARLLWEEKTQKDHQVQEKLLLLSRVLNLEVIPRRIECFDISHSGGTDTVASMAVFEDGQPAPKQYRHFKIRRDQNDDFASLAEAVKRRFLRAREGDPSFSPEPDLLIIDGGLGQVNTVKRVLQELGVKVPLFGLAEKNEEIYSPGAKRPLVLSRRNEALKLLQSIRDEAHRFAVEYNRKLGSRKMKKSILDSIAGIGEKRKKNLLNHFGSVKRIKEASLEEIASVAGMNRPAAENVYNCLHQKGKI